MATTLASDRDPEVDRRAHADAVARLGGVGGAEDDHGRADDVGEGHADGPQHVRARSRGTPGRPAPSAPVLRLPPRRNAGRLVDPAPDEVAGDDHDGAQQERDPPAPGVEGLVGQDRGQRQEDGGGDDRRRPGCPAGRSWRSSRGGRTGRAPRSWRWPRPARRPPRSPGRAAAAPAGAGASMPDLGVGGQQPDGEGRRRPSASIAQDQHVLAAVPVAPVPEDDRADRPGEVADGVGGQRRDSATVALPFGKKTVGKTRAAAWA